MALAVSPLVASAAGNVVGNVIARFDYDEIYGVQEFISGLAISYLVVLVLCVAVLVPMHSMLLRRMRRPVMAYSVFGFLMGCALALAILLPLNVPLGSRASIEVGLVCGLTVGLASLTFWRIVMPDGVHS